MPDLRLTADHIKTHMFNGGFKPFDKYDWYSYSDADEGSLIADIPVGSFLYQVVFSPEMGNVEINYVDKEGNSYCWEMDLNTGKYIEL
jgi:hypothetical protein